MTDPFRSGSQLLCPACEGALREFRGRLVCDACDGIMLTVEDLVAGIHDMTSIAATFEWTHEKPGKRKCPHCGEAMTACHVIVHLENDLEKPKPELDRCATHGVWFDREELAKVFEKVATKGYGGGVGRTFKGEHSRVDDGRWSAMFPYFGGRGGF
jgi:Zn-finger nucleic acid-binding protein